MNRRIAFATALLVAALPVPAASSKSLDVVLTTSYPELTDAQRKLTSVPFADDAPAVVLLKIRQEDWKVRGAIPVHRTTYFRRVKILTDAGAKDFGILSFSVRGGLKSELLQARTILPDGTILDAREAVRESSPRGDRRVEVTFPKVSAGAILDFMARFIDDDATQFIEKSFIHDPTASLIRQSNGPNIDKFNEMEDVDRFYGIEPFVLEEALPVVETHLVYAPPATLMWRSIPQGIAQEQAIPTWDKTLFGKTFFWSFTNIPALPAEANRPAAESLSRTLYVVPLSIPGAGELARDWKSWRDREEVRWSVWMKRMHRDLDALAQKVAGSGTTALEKAEAIRVALQQRVSATIVSRAMLNEQPDGALASGKATTGEMAALASIMLRAVDVPSVLGSTRRRSSGPINPGIVIPAAFEDVILKLDGPSGPRWWSPASMVPAGELPLDLHGVYVLPHDTVADKPIPTPPASPQDNRIARTTTGRLDVTGAVEAQTVMTCSTLAAEPWRAQLRGLDETGRRDAVRRDLQRHVPGAEVTWLEIGGLESGEFKLTYTWKAQNVAAVDGNRLLVKPLFHERVVLDAWPDRPRQTNIVLGHAREVSDSLTLTLDDDVTIASATGPGRVQLQANAVNFEYMADSWSHKVVARRSFKLPVGAFPAADYGSLRKLMVEAAHAEDKPVVITLAE